MLKSIILSNRMAMIYQQFVKINKEANVNRKGDKPKWICFSVLFFVLAATSVFSADKNRKIDLKIS